MNINSVSFGRTIKVNAPYKVAQEAVDLINTVPTKKGKSNVKQKLKDIFYDTDQGIARVVAPDGKKGDIFIVSGEASQDVCLVSNHKKFNLDYAKKQYGKDSATYEEIKKSEKERYSDLLKLIIMETQEPMEIGLKYSNKKHCIESIDIVI